MCGRYAATKDPARLAAEFDAIDATGEDAPERDFNVAPTKPVIAVVSRHPRDADGTPDADSVVRSLRVMRWGLIPHWAKSKSIGSKMINARSETADTKPAYRTSMTKRRCLLPADGWFEWRRDANGKQPFYMTRGDGSSLAMAGLWSVWRDPAATDPDAPPLVTCAVLTRDAVGALAEIHDRMPVLLGPQTWSAWLDPDRTDVADLLAEPDPALLDALELRPVSDEVNSVRNNGPTLIELAEPTTNLDLDEPALFDLAPANPPPKQAKRLANGSITRTLTTSATRVPAASPTANPATRVSGGSAALPTDGPATSAAADSITNSAPRVAVDPTMVPAPHAIPDPTMDPAPHSVPGPTMDPAPRAVPDPAGRG